MEPATGDPKNRIDDFLIAEHQHFADSVWRTEETGEKSLNFFVSLLTAAVAGLVVLITSDSGFTDEQVQWVSFSAGIALLLVGLSTLVRMLQRDAVADQYKHAMSLIRQSFLDRYTFVGYAPFDLMPRRRLFTGGLAQTVALLNSMIAGAITAIGLLFAASPVWLALGAGLAFVLGFAAQLAYIRQSHMRM